MSSTVPPVPVAAPAASSGVGNAGMWIFLATDAMGFGGLFMAYGVLRTRAAAWPDARAHLALAPAAVMTFALLVSAFTVAQAARAAKPGARRGWLAATAVLGLIFLGGEGAEYRRLASGADPVRLGLDLFGATFYALTGYHGLHVAAGLACLIAGFVGKARARTIEVVALYWQFVDLAWMPIFTFFYLWPAR
jgi:cytochrome c oxidase subunit 3